MKKIFALIPLIALSASCAAQLAPGAIELKQRNSDNDGWAAPRIVPQANSLLIFDASRQPGTALLSTFARTADLAAKENTGVAALLLTAHTAAANPHAQYALASSLSSYATLTTLNSATTALTTAINGRAASTHTHAQTDITNLATTLASKADVTALNSATAALTDAIKDQNSGVVIKRWFGTQTAYDAIAIKDANTAYFIFAQ